MAQVDPSDDEIDRFVVHRYAYDPARHGRRHVVTAAFDHSREFEATIEAETTELRRRRQSGEDVDPQEQISGIVREPGYHRKQRAGRLIEHALKHGARLDTIPGTVSPTTYHPIWQSCDSSPNRFRRRRRACLLFR